MRRDKLIGILFLVLSTMSSIWLMLLIFSNILVILRILIFITALPIIIGLLVIGVKLLVYESIEPISPRDLYMNVLKSYKGPRCIAISGIDGAGKSTQLWMLSKILKDLGINNKVVWFRWPALLSYPFLAIARFLGYAPRLKIKRREASSEIVYIMHEYYRNKALAKIISMLLIVDFTIMFIIRILIPLKILRLRRWILCDRFILDVIVDLYDWTKDLSIFDRMLLILYKKFLSICPSIVLDVEETKAFNRKKDIPSITYLKIRKQILNFMAKIFELSVINTSYLSRNETFKIIIKTFGIEELIELRKLARIFKVRQ